MNPAWADLAAQTAIVTATTGWALLAAFVAVALVLIAVRAIGRAEVGTAPTPEQQEDNVARVESWWTT